MTSAVTSSFSRKLQWNRISRELHQQLIFGVGAAKRCRVNKLERQRFAFARISSRKIQSRATVDPDASNSSIQSRTYMNQLLLLNQSQALHIQSTWFPDARKEEVAKLCIQSTKISAEDEFSRSVKPVAKQLTI
ncbi:hypothetical protein F511_36913 [Dorcoceras hygrometricum]|uniref:Uncharacterized protein n=1 Tax=Dorcoceras hygrometricum TaxID=472368 RepID=A0A2Z7B0F6_9LAMI|nr:hypothetical protein F511_36913 [Dorcoceras hygrometricum]